MWNLPPCLLQQNLEKIIQRDFFPDVTKLQAQKDYLEAEENGDLERMRAISIQYGSTLAKSTPRTPAPCQYNEKWNKILCGYAILEHQIWPNMFLSLSDLTPASFETPVGRARSPSSTHGSKALEGGKKLNEFIHGERREGKKIATNKNSVGEKNCAKPIIFL